MKHSLYMSKILKFTKACPKCKTPMVIPVAESDVGKNKIGVCPKCQARYTIPIPMAWASKFETDPTVIGGGAPEMALLLETIPNEFTAYQSFELTSDYYTIGRKNNGGPEFRSDVEVVTTDKMMSRKHAAITKKGHVGFTLKDIRSKNGIRVNNESGKMDNEEEVYLNDGDTFCLGQTRFRVSFTEHTSDTEDVTR